MTRVHLRERQKIRVASDYKTETFATLACLTLQQARSTPAILLNRLFCPADG